MDSSFTTNGTTAFPIQSKLNDSIFRVTEIGQHPESSPHVKRHLCFGVSRRLAVVGHNYSVVERLIREQGDIPIYGSVSQDFITHMASFYVHTKGICDNLTWAIIHKNDATIDESNWQHRRQADLCKPEFIETLRSLNHSVAEVIQSKQDWLKEIKDTRDPIAHRIPLYVPPFTLTEAQAAQFNSVREQAQQAIYRGDFEAAERLRDEYTSIGQFVPIVCREVNGTEQTADIMEQLNHDITNLLDIVEAISSTFS